VEKSEFFDYFSSKNLVYTIDDIMRHKIRFGLSLRTLVKQSLYWIATASGLAMMNYSDV